MPEEPYRVPLGTAAVRREGSDVTIVGTSLMAVKAQAAAEKLAAEGISAEVIDLRCIRPIDFATIAKSVEKTHRLMIVYEGVKTMGIGAEISAMIAERVTFLIFSMHRSCVWARLTHQCRIIPFWKKPLCHRRKPFLKQRASWCRDAADAG